MNFTENYSFRKPEDTDPVDIDVLNENFDLIDTLLKSKEGSGGTGIAYYDLDLVSAGITLPITEDSSADITSVISGQEVLALVSAGTGIRVLAEDSGKTLVLSVPLTASYDYNETTGGYAAILGGFYTNPFDRSHSEMTLVVTEANGEYTVTLYNYTNFYEKALGTLPEDVTALQESVKANTDAIDGIPVAVDDNGYTVITGQERATRIAAVRTEERTTLTFTMQGGEEITGVLEYDDNGLPVSYTENDLTVELGLTGFDDLVVAEWEGGSY